MIIDTEAKSDFGLVSPVDGQQRECECGTITTGMECPDCGGTPWPCWAVVDSAGRVHGYVAGANNRDAIRSADATPSYDWLRSFTVAPILSFDD